MKRKLTALILTLLITTTLIQAIVTTAAYAINITIDLAICSDGDLINISDKATATTTGRKHICHDTILLSFLCYQ